VISPVKAVLLYAGLVILKFNRISIILILKNQIYPFSFSDLPLSVFVSTANFLSQVRDYRSSQSSVPGVNKLSMVIGPLILSTFCTGGATSIVRAKQIRIKANFLRKSFIDQQQWKISSQNKRRKNNIPRQNWHQFTITATALGWADWARSLHCCYYY
jgi:hypothetical protein